jgi:hypothetical protein
VMQVGDFEAMISRNITCESKMRRRPSSGPSDSGPLLRNAGRLVNADFHKQEIMSPDSRVLETISQ